MIGAAPHALPLLLIGNALNRRVVDFCAAARERGWPRPVVVGHHELLSVLELLERMHGGDPAEALAEHLEAAGAPVGQDAFVRIDSAGEDTEVERALLRLGWPAIQRDEAARVDSLDPLTLASMEDRHGQILAPRQRHLGFERYLDALEGALASQPRWRVLNPIADLRVLFDKRALSQRYADQGIPVTDAIRGEALAAIDHPDALREAMVERRWPSVYVKLSSGSSASCLALFRHIPSHIHRGRSRRGPPEMALTTVARSGEARFNSLRLQRLEQRERVDELLGWLLSQGAQIERAHPKLRLNGRSCDLRVLTVDGEPSFVVVRTSRHPITNLHLGGQRGDLDALEAALPPRAWDAAMATCARAAAQHDTFHLGVDLLFEAGGEPHRVVEANAFGDLLPRLERDGLSVYAYQLAQLERRLAG